MGIKTEYKDSKLPFVFMVQLVSLLIMGIVEFLNMTEGFLLPINLHLLMNGGIALSLLLFWAITVLKAPRSVLRRDVILGIVMVLWFLILEMNRRINYIPLQSITVFVSVYLIALPFAAITQDQDRQAGLRLVAGIYILASLIFLGLGLHLFAGGQFPGTLNGQVYWDGARLLIIHHPNIISRMFMIAMALCMGFLGQAKQIGAKALMLLAAILLFAAIALTNTRAVIIVACVILAGNVFFLFYNQKRKRVLLGAAAALLAVVVLFLSSGWLFQWNISRLVNQSTMQAMEPVLTVEVPDEGEPDSVLQVIPPEETPLAADPAEKLKGNNNSDQDSLLTDLLTMNSRNEIWGAFFRKIQNEPAILLRGTVDTRLVFNNIHTHNAWLEALIMLGIPGFILVLFFSWEATWASLRLLWYTGTDLFRKNIALLTLATLVAALMEPCLFITYLEWNFSDFFFFLCLGYLTLWNKQLPLKQ